LSSVTNAFVLVLLAGCGASSSSGLLRPSDRAPDFSAQDQSGATRTLREFRGKNVVLYFYPRDGTPGCTAEACAFRDAWDRLHAAGGEVIGVSMDSVESHRAFAEEHELEFPLLADPDGRILESYGVSSVMGVSSRVTFVIDGSGVVRRVFENVDPAIHVDEVTDVLESLRRVTPTRGG
jgi:thioredoxin-dependent peroxiredoxin